MGLKTGSGGKPMTFYQLKAKIDDNTDPTFVQSEKVNGNWTNTQEGNEISGTLAGAKIETRKIKDIETNFFVLFLEDENGLMKVQIGHSRIAYSIINSIASNANKINEYTVSVYKKQSEDGKYWNGKAACKTDTGRLEWAIDPRKAPERQPVMIGKPPKQQMKGGKPVWDYSDQAAFWENLFNENIVKAVGTGGAHANTSSGNTTNASTASSSSSAMEDDLPF